MPENRVNETGRLNTGRADWDGRFIDSLGQIPPDEPIYIFRAQDFLAPYAVDFYAWLLEIWAFMAATIQIFGPFTQERIEAIRAQAQMVRSRAEAMRQWTPRKFPDVPPQADEGAATSASVTVKAGVTDNAPPFLHRPEPIGGEQVGREGVE